ncbi:uncharacterized protein LOC143036625 [Oratosquilla oratoria]|uniref:uncharacterized protein LOC143036625 n=1 Tax=Oratosquilla oratoria TaxID=337810 RepID=UPI003F75DC91
MARRRAASVWLLGHSEEELTGSRLPSNGQVLKHFFYHHFDLKCMKSESAKAVVEAVFLFWAKAQIPTTTLFYAKKKLTDLVTKYEGLKKNRLRDSENQRMKEQMFCDDLDEIFDVAHKDALIMMKNEEDKAFLLSQREDRSQSSMAGIDMDHLKSLEKKKKRAEVEDKRKKKSEAEKRLTVEVVSSSTLADSSSSSESSADDSFQIHSHKKRKKSDAISAGPSIPKNIFLKPEVTAALDRTGVSHRKAMHQLGAQAKSIGIDIEQITLSQSSIYRYRKKNREEAATSIKADIMTRIPRDTPLVLHWDGKLLPDITVASSGREKAERIAILASGDGVEFLLGVPKIGSSSGTDQANACLSAINDWGLSHQIKAIVFDTTASNTGLLQGACIKIQEQLQKELVWLACRHHVYEVILADVFRSAYGPSSGPSIPLFSRFQDLWGNLDKRNFKTAEDDEEILANFVGDWSVPREEAMRRLEVALRLTATRDDYRELTTLAYIFLGEEAVGLSLFDDRISPDEKRKMVDNMSLPAKPKGLKRVDGKTFSTRISLPEFFTMKTKSIFPVILSEEPEFLTKDPSSWENDDLYRRFEKAAHELKAVNDCAERAISLIQQFNTVITKDEDQRQFLLRVVQEHRKEIPLPKKSAFK